MVRPALMALHCRLDLPPAAMAQLEQLAQRLHQPSTDALVSHLVVQGLGAVMAQLSAAWEPCSQPPPPPDAPA